MDVSRNVYAIKLKGLFCKKVSRFTFLQPEPHFSNSETKVLAKALAVGCHDAKGAGARIRVFC